MVELEGGETLRTPLVISNADVRQTFEELLDPESIDPRFMKRLRRMRPNCSAVVVQAATTLDLSGEDLASEVFRPLGYDADAEWQGIGQGRPGGLWAAFPTREDPSLAPPGEHIAVLTSLAGTASLRVMVSGLHAAQMALVRTGSPPLDFGHGDAPPV